MCQVQGLRFSTLEVQDRKALCQLEFSPGSDNGFPKQEESRGPLAVPSIGLLPKKGEYPTYISNNVVALFALSDTALSPVSAAFTLLSLFRITRGKQTTVGTLVFGSRAEGRGYTSLLSPRLFCFEELSLIITFLLSFIYC